MKLTKRQLQKLIKEELENVIREVGDPKTSWHYPFTGGGQGPRWRHTGKKNALTKTVDQFMREMAHGTDVGTLWDKQGLSGPKIRSNMVDGIPVVNINSQHMNMHITLPNKGMPPVVTGKVLSKQGKWIHFKNMRWNEATTKIYSHLQGSRGLRTGRGTGTKTMHGDSKTQKTKVHLDNQGRRTEKELEALKKKLKNPRHAKAAQKEIEILEKALKTGQNKVGKLAKFVSKLPIIGRFAVLSLFLFAAKDAYAAEGAEGVAKVTAETGVDMTPVVGDIKGLIELGAMTGQSHKKGQVRAGGQYY